MQARGWFISMGEGSRERYEGYSKACQRRGVCQVHRRIKRSGLGSGRRPLFPAPAPPDGVSAGGSERGSRQPGPGGTLAPSAPITPISVYPATAAGRTFLHATLSVHVSLLRGEKDGEEEEEEKEGWTAHPQCRASSCQTQGAQRDAPPSVPPRRHSPPHTPHQR